MTEKEYLEFFIANVPEYSHWRYGAFAYNNNNEIIHAAFYENPLDEVDLSSLIEELSTDTQLGMTSLTHGKDFTIKTWSDE